MRLMRRNARRQTAAGEMACTGSLLRVDVFPSDDLPRVADQTWHAEVSLRYVERGRLQRTASRGGCKTSPAMEVVSRGGKG